MIAITFALPQESAPLIAMLRGRQAVERGALPVVRGNLAASEVIVLHHGIGAAFSDSRVATFLERHRPEILISTGFAGGLDLRLKVGDVVFAENFSDGVLLEKVRPLRLDEARTFFGSLTTQAQAAETSAQKSALFHTTGALAVDMETAGIRARCEKAGIPMLSVRAVSDSASQRLPVPFPVWFDENKQKPRVAALLGYLALHPLLIPEFARFARGTFHASHTLANCLAVTVEAIELSP